MYNISSNMLDTTESDEMKYIIYILTMVPIYQLSSVSQAIDPYDSALYITGLWGTIWFSITLSLGPLGRKLKIRDAIVMKQPMGLATATWFSLHFIMYLVLHQDSVGYALQDILTKPFLLLGGISLTILLALAATSTHGMIRRCGKWWKPLHEMVVIAAALGGAHGLVAQKTTTTEGAAVALLLTSAVIIRYGIRK